MKTSSLLLLLLLSACAPRPKAPAPGDPAENPPSPPAQTEIQAIVEQITANAKENVAWDGLYQGVLPCNLDHCDGVAMSLLLGQDQSYMIRSRNVGVSNEDNYLEGFFEWRDSNTIELKNNNETLPFRVSVLALEMLSPKGETLSEQYKLEKVFDAPPAG